MSIGALPSVLPVPFFTEGRTIVFPCATTQLVEAVDGTVVAFQTDGRDHAACGYWTVLAQGRCSISPHHPGAEAAFTAAWSGNLGAPIAVLEIERLSGWLTPNVAEDPRDARPLPPGP